MNELLLLSGIELARRIAAGEVRSRAVVDAHIERAQSVNPRLNAVVAERYDLARREADAADAALAAPRDKPLALFHGVPCTIKEAFALEGMPNASGLVSRRNFRATHDATTVARMRAAGAIPIGVTNTSELCMWMESHNHLYGRTSNPYDSGRMVGGSSGGEGAIVGAGASPFGLGSDVGGSIRMPSFFNGIFGHKASSGLIPNSGQFPETRSVEINSLLASGPMCRRAEDLMPLVRLMAGPDGIDPVCEVRELGDETKVDVARLRVFSVEGNGIRRVSRDLLARQREAAARLNMAGANVVPHTIKRLRGSLPIWANRMGNDDCSYRDRLGDGGANVSPLRHDLLAAFGRTPHTLPSIALALAESIPFVAPKEDPRARTLQHALRAELDELLGDDGVLLFPSYTRPAPRHNAPLLTPIDWLYTAIFNAMELPVTQVPLGLNEHGHPLGIQVVGPHKKDELTIAVALFLEKEFGGWVPPWTSNNPHASK